MIAEGGRWEAKKRHGGEGGIRTHGTRKGSTVFETARFNRSRTSPFPLLYHFSSLVPSENTLNGIAALGIAADGGDHPSS